MWKEDGPDSPRGNNFVATLWGIWLHRNSILFKRSAVSPRNIMEIIKKMNEDNQVAIDLRNRINKNTNIKGGSHTNPVAILIGDFNNTGVKLMVDGAWKEKKNGDSVAAIGWMIKHDQITLSKGGCRIRASSALQAEGYAILRGLIEAEKRNIKQITTLSDSRIIYTMLKEGKIGSTEIASILEDIRNSARNFDFCSIVNVSRNLIKPAHDLANIARKHGMVDVV